MGNTFGKRNRVLIFPRAFILLSRIGYIHRARSFIDIVRSLLPYQDRASFTSNRPPGRRQLFTCFKARILYRNIRGVSRYDGYVIKPDMSETAALLMLCRRQHKRESSADRALRRGEGQHRRRAPQLIDPVKLLLIRLLLKQPVILLDFLQ
ncbi:hypothetical protein D3C78_786350 [compost metagenome]